MKTIAMRNKPANFPKNQVNGSPLKPLTQLLLDRRATNKFKPDPVPEEHLQAILELAAQAPSGYNLQPWRFVVVRDQDSRDRLQKAAMDQSKVGEAPVVVIAFGIKDEWKEHMDEIFREGARRGAGKEEDVEELKEGAEKFLETISQEVWINRHTMIAVTTMMLAAEAYGLDTAPMEGFDPEAVKEEFGLPEDAVVVALLCIGFARMPDKPYTGRLPLEEMVFEDHGSRPWKGHSGQDE